MRSIRRAHLLLLVLALPFVVGFDIPDTSGTYMRLSGGKGAYHLTGCHRNFDSEFYEGQVGLRHTFASGTEDPEASTLRKIAPRFTTLAAHGDFIVQDLTVVLDSAKTDNTLGNTESARAFEGGAYLGMDWKWVGVNLGLSAALFNIGIDDAEKQGANLIAGLRLGLTDFLYFSLEAAGSNPYLTGGGGKNAGFGAKFGDTRAWAGVGDYGFPGSEAMAMLRLNQAYGPWDFALAGQFGTTDVPPSNLGIDNEYGLSIGVAYRLSSLK